MARLCVEMCPWILTEDIIGNLSQRKICTVIHVLQEDKGKLAAISKLELKDVVALRTALGAHCSPFPEKGLDVYNELLAHCACVPSGIKDLDRLLGGGFTTGKIYEICGMSGVGKTELCFTLAVNCAQQLKRKVHFVDTKGDFSGKRILSILDARSTESEETGHIMERILVTRVHSFFELYSFLYRLKDQLNREPKSTRFIIVESLPSVFLQFMGRSKIDSIGLMNCLAGLMKYIAEEQHVIIIVINLTKRWIEDVSAPLTDSDDETLSSSSSSCEIKPLLGKYWAHIPNTRILIENSKQSDLRTIIVTKSTHLAIGEACKVKFHKSGVL